MNQQQGGACTMCGAEGTNKTTCPFNPQARHPDPMKHKKHALHKTRRGHRHRHSHTQSQTQRRRHNTHFMVLYHIAYRRTSDTSSDPDPTPEELENYVSTSTYIPENPIYSYPAEYFIDPPHYIGHCTFKFVLKKHKHMHAAQLARDLLFQSFADGEWAATPGNGSFVYPDSIGDELGLLYFDYVIVNGKRYGGGSAP